MIASFEWADAAQTELKRYCGSRLDVVVPEGTVVIGPEAFAGRAVRSVQLPNSLCSIGRMAFRRCRSLRQIEIPGTVHTIEPEAFDGCDGLQHLVLHEGLQQIGMRAFWYCSSLRQIEIPASVQRVASKAFEGCSLLDRVVLRSTDTFVDEYAFRETRYEARLLRLADRCAAGEMELDTLELPEGMTHVDTFQFSRGRFRKLILPSSLRTVGMNAFRGCSRLQQVILSPNTYCNYHGSHQSGQGRDGIFADCTQLEHLILRGQLRPFVWYDEQTPQLLKGFDPEKTFAGCYKLNRITAYEVPLQLFPSRWRRWAINGYLADTQRKKHYLPEICAGYDSVLLQREEALHSRAVASPEDGALQYLMEHRMILHDRLEDLKQAAARASTPELLAALLEYERQHLSVKQVDPFAQAWEALELL